MVVQIPAIVIVLGDIITFIQHYHISHLNQK